MAFRHSIRDYVFPEVIYFLHHKVHFIAGDAVAEPVQEPQQQQGEHQCVTITFYRNQVFTVNDGDSAGG